MPVTGRLLIVPGIVTGPVPLAENPVMTSPPLPSDCVVFWIFVSWACAATGANATIKNRATDANRRREPAETRLEDGINDISAKVGDELEQANKANSIR